MKYERWQGNCALCGMSDNEMSTLDIRPNRFGNFYGQDKSVKICGDCLGTIMERIEQNADNEQSNSGFICECCGRHEIYSPCRITLDAAYGSIHDGEQRTLEICGACFDRMWNLVQELGGKDE